VASKFKDSLTDLIVKLQSTSPHYVRCIKPNTLKAPNNWDGEMVQAQLRYAGMMETIRIRKLGFPIRLPFKEFWDRYRMIAPLVPKEADMKRNVENLTKSFKFLQKDQWQNGKDKFFMREQVKATLEDNRNVALKKIAIIIQKFYRGFRVRRRFLKIKKAALVFQKHTRKWKQRKIYVLIRNKIMMAQSVVKMHQKRIAFKNIREKARLIQACQRIRVARVEFALIKKAKLEREEQERLEAERRKKELALLEAKEREEAEKRERERLEREKKKKN